jgi:hypothetical protein
MDAKGAFTDLSSKASALLVGAPCLFAGCCDVIEPDLSVTLDNYLISFSLLYKFLSINSKKVFY